MSYETTDPAGAKEILEGDPDVRTLDVRSEQEFAMGHIEGAYNVPLLFFTPQGMQPNPAFVEAVQKHFETEERLVLVCKAGVRSARACELLEQVGFGRLINMHGGMVAATDPYGNVSEPGWTLCGHPTTQEAVEGRTWEELQG